MKKCLCVLNACPLLQVVPGGKRAVVSGVSGRARVSAGGGSAADRQGAPGRPREVPVLGQQLRG